MNGSETSTPPAWPSGADQPGELLGGVAEAAADVEHAVPVSGGWSRIAASPCALSPATTRSRYSTKRSKSTPLQASVASSFSAATSPARGTVTFSTRSWYARGPGVTHQA